MTLRIRRGGVLFVLLTSSRRIVSYDVESESFLSCLLMVRVEGNNVVKEGYVDLSCPLNCLNVTLSSVHDTFTLSGGSVGFNSVGVGVA